MKRSGWIGAAACAALVTQAWAAPATLPQTLTSGFGSTQWSISNTSGTTGPFTGTCTGAGLGVNDAQGPTGAGDAYDVAWTVWVNGTQIVAPSNVDVTGQTLTAGPVAVGTLAVTVQYYPVPNTALLRTLVTVQNNGAATATATVQSAVNFGSDSSSTIRGTSSGDTTITSADRWIVSSDNGPSDPVLTTVFYGSGGSVPPTSYTTPVFDCAATNGVGATFDVPVPAGGSRSVAFFAGLGGITVNDNTIASALAQAAAIFDTANGLSNVGGFAGVNTAQLVNWNPVAPPPAATAPIPTLSETALAALALLVGALGWRQLGRRDRHAG